MIPKAIADTPKDDAAAWMASPAHRWVYNRLEVGTHCAPMGVRPDDEDFPVVVKPVINLEGMGAGARIVCDRSDFDALGDMPGFMWSRLLTGRHVSIDAMVKDGEIEWSAHALGVSAGPQRVACWVLGGPQYIPEHNRVADFVRDRLRDYSGPLNVELVGREIIEVHLRLTADWIEAGAYDAYPGDCVPMVGIPLYEPMPSTTNLQHAKLLVDAEGPRHGLLAIRAAE